MQVLVTGGTGFIGSHLVMRLLKEGHEITIIDYNSEFFDSISKSKLHIYRLGAEDSGCDKIFAASCFALVYHLGYFEPADEINEQALYRLHTNTAGLSNILTLAHKYHVPRVIVLSSYHVYGWQQEKLISEDSPLRPIETIGHQMRTRELLCSEHRQRGMNVTILRISCVYGPLNSSGFTYFIQEYIKELLNTWHNSAQAGDNDTDSDGLTENRFDASSELALHDFLYVGDLVEALILVAAKDPSPVMNISSGTGATRGDVERICRLLSEKRATDFGLAGDFTDEAVADIPLPVHNPDDLPGASSFILDNQMACKELGWSPRISLAEGLRKTFEWSFRKMNDLTLNEPVTVREPDHKFRLSVNQRRTILTVSLAVVACLLTYSTQYQLNIESDFLLLYVMSVSLLFGIRHGALAILLAVFGRVIILMAVENKTLVSIFNDSDLMMLITLYLILGVCIGYAIDYKLHQKENIKNDLTKTRRELEFVSILYQKSLEVKNNLQISIENNTNSLGKLIHLISRMHQAKENQLYAEAAAIYADILQARDVQVYSTDAAGHWLRLVATIGDAKFGKSIAGDQFSFLGAVYHDNIIYVNHELNPKHPMICAPIRNGRQFDAIVFIDGIEFIKLTQQFVNTVKALTVLVSDSIENKYRQFESLENEKYFRNTTLMKQEWFEKEIQDKVGSSKSKAMLVSIEEKILNYRKFNRAVCNLIRSTDLVGEFSQGKLGIILTETDQKNFSVIKERFAEKGYTIAQTSEEVS